MGSGSDEDWKTKMSSFYFFVQKNCSANVLVDLVKFMFVLRNKSNYLLKHFITICSRKPQCSGI